MASAGRSSRQSTVVSIPAAGLSAVSCPLVFSSCAISPFVNTMKTRKRQYGDGRSPTFTERLSQGGRAVLGSAIGSAILVILAGPFWSVSGLGSEWTLSRVVFAAGALVCSVGIVTFYARRG
jgi:hypothetical protein